MFFQNFIIFVCAYLTSYKLSWCLEELPPVVENDIVTTEAVIRLTINKLFSNLRLHYTGKAKSKDFITVHKYFTSLSLQDYENLKEISRQTKVGYKNKNNETDFIAIINEILAEEHIVREKNDTDIINNDENVIQYIEHFLKKLHVLKEIYSVDKTYVNINTDVLKLLRDANFKQTNYSSNTEFSSYKSEENDTVLDENEFWEPSGRRIFKGDRTKIKEYPFMATILIFNNFHCAGSIIKSDLIITASSCLQLAYNNRLFRENPSFLSARVGSSFYNSGGEVIPVLEVYFHPGYDPKTLRNNICLLRLSRHLKFRRKSRRVKKIDIDRHEFGLSMSTPGITIVGWGAKENSQIIGNPWKNILSFAVLDVYPIQDCQDVYSKAYVTKKNFCAGFISRGGGACNRDVGGPGIDNGKLIGVVSFGSPVCGAPDTPTVFTKLGFYADWIEEILEQEVVTSKKRTTLKPAIDLFTAPPSYIPSHATTFKIAPLSGKKMSPISITHIDNPLRMSDEGLFREFLAAMFTSQEISEYQNILNVNDENEDNVVTGHVEIIQNEIVTENSQTLETYPITALAENIDQQEEPLEEVKHETEMIEFSKEETNSDSFSAPIIDKESPVVFNLNKDISHFLQNVQEKVTNEDQIYDDDGKNETVLTLLYLSDDDKQIKIPDKKNAEDKTVEGLSIPVEQFEDFTRTRKDILDILPDNELYVLLSEVIQDEWFSRGKSIYETLRLFLSYIKKYSNNINKGEKRLSERRFGASPEEPRPEGPRWTSNEDVRLVVSLSDLWLGSMLLDNWNGNSTTNIS